MLTGTPKRHPACSAGAIAQLPLPTYSSTIACSSFPNM